MPAPQAALRLALLLPLAAAGGGPATAGGVELRLEDGRVVALAGVEVPPPARAAAGALLAGLGEGLGPDAGARPDRHGRLRAQARGGGGAWAQRELVGAGLALAAPAEDVADAAFLELLAAERAARAARRGVWAGGTAGPWPAARVGAELPGYLLVAGKVEAVARARGFVYLNFGRRWKEDFTVRAEERVARRLAREGLELADLKGRELLVRGLVFEQDGPMVELFDRRQVEVLR